MKCIKYSDVLMDKFKEECGVFGVYDTEHLDEEVSILTYYGLFSLQHRGQESCGIAFSDGKTVKCKKSMGLVSESFSKEILNDMNGYSSIGHVRYSTKGKSEIKNAQPILVNYKLGTIAIAHNGTLVNSDILKDLLEDAGVIFQTSSDSEVILNLIAREAKKGFKSAVTNAMQAVKGSYAIAILTQEGLIAARDPYGIRPLCIGKKDSKFFISSESCAFDSIGAEFIRDVRPGEIIMISENGLESIYELEKTKCATCAFEYIYFARPDSTIDGISVYKTREKSGEILAANHMVGADIVTGVPDSGIPATIGFSKKSGIPYEIGLIKNKYVGRTFIAPNQELREHFLSVKLSVLKDNVRGKKVILIDDSIVRGTTSKKIVKMLKEAGATEVHLRISSPPIKYPCYFGIDTPYRKGLIASSKTITETVEKIEADSLEYLSTEELLEILGNKDDFCLGCFTGVYPLSTPILDNEGNEGSENDDKL